MKALGPFAVRKHWLNWQIANTGGNEQGSATLCIARADLSPETVRAPANLGAP